MARVVLGLSAYGIEQTRPVNVYGASKVAGEQLVMMPIPASLIRSAGLYGTATSRKGWTFPELMVSKGRSDGWVKVVTDQALSPTYTHDLAQTTQALMARDARGLFHVTNEGECSWYEFAQATFDITGIAVNLDPRRPSLVNGAPGPLVPRPRE